MQCPACNHALSQVQSGSLTVDACKGGCGGLWFDQLEVRKVDDPDEDASGLLEIERDPSVVVDSAKRLKCPKCDDVVLMRHYFSVKRAVQVDECPSCGGFWLDAGELAQIRAEYHSEEERSEDAQKAFAATFDPQLTAILAQDQQRAEGFARIARFFTRRRL